MGDKNRKDREKGSERAGGGRNPRLSYRIRSGMKAFDCHTVDAPWAFAVPPEGADLPRASNQP